MQDVLKAQYRREYNPQYPYTSRKRPQSHFGRKKSQIGWNSQFYRANTIGQRVIMVGGGLVGCETARHPAKTGHIVTVIEMLERLAHESYGMYSEALLLEMEKYHITAKARTRCLEITSTGIKVENGDGTRGFIAADTVVYALGMKANSTAELRAAAEGIPVYEIGDCVRMAKVIDATEEGFMAAMKIV
jgi:pyruvate/2-oxoglutarate dehydrogenase complex dihydrolipoamide dehydrogenase (E3) component